jgi:hypothetical protein
MLSLMIVAGTSEAGFSVSTVPRRTAFDCLQMKNPQNGGFFTSIKNSKSVLVAGFGLVVRFLGGLGRTDSLVFAFGFIRSFLAGLGIAAAVAHLLCLGRGTGATTGLGFGFGLGLLLSVDCGQREGKSENCRETEDFLHTLLLLVNW